MIDASANDSGFCFSALAHKVDSQYIRSVNHHFGSEKEPSRSCLFFFSDFSIVANCSLLSFALHLCLSYTCMTRHISDGIWRKRALKSRLSMSWDIRDWHCEDESRRLSYPAKRILRPNRTN
jgi:hypothetical protein